MATEDRISSFLFLQGSVLILGLITASKNRTLSSWVIFVQIGPSILFVWFFILITRMICFVNFLFAFRLFLISYLCLPGCSYFPRGTPEGNMNCLLIQTILSPLVIIIIPLSIELRKDRGEVEIIATSNPPRKTYYRHLHLIHFSKTQLRIK